MRLLALHHMSKALSVNYITASAKATVVLKGKRDEKVQDVTTSWSGFSVVLQMIWHDCSTWHMSSTSPFTAFIRRPQRTD